MCFHTYDTFLLQPWTSLDKDTTLNHDSNQLEDYSSLYSSTEFDETFQVETVLIFTRDFLICKNTPKKFWFSQKKSIQIFQITIKEQIFFCYRHFLVNWLFETLCGSNFWPFYKFDVTTKTSIWIFFHQILLRWWQIYWGSPKVLIS